MGDRAEILDQLGLRHADAGILDRQRLGGLVGGEADLELARLVGDVLFRELQVAELFQRVGRVGH